MSEELREISDQEQWLLYQQMFAFAGNELLVPMNRSHNLQGLDPAFWHSSPVPNNSLGEQGSKRLEEYAAASQAHAGEEDTSVPGMLQASVEYTHLFIGPPSPVAPPWETTNSCGSKGKVSYGSATVEMRRLLAAEGLALGGEMNQMEDHIGIELLLLSALCDKAQKALCNGDEDAVRELSRKASQFALIHPLSFIGKLREKVDGEAPEGYYSALLQYSQGLLVSFVDFLPTT